MTLHVEWLGSLPMDCLSTGNDSEWRGDPASFCRCFHHGFRSLWIRSQGNFPLSDFSLFLLFFSISYFFSIRSNICLNSHTEENKLVNKRDERPIKFCIIFLKIERKYAIFWSWSSLNVVTTWTDNSLIYISSFVLLLKILFLNLLSFCIWLCSYCQFMKLMFKICILYWF